MTILTPTLLEILMSLPPHTSVGERQNVSIIPLCWDLLSLDLAEIAGHNKWRRTESAERLIIRLVNATNKILAKENQQ